MFIPGDLVFFVYYEGTEQLQTGGVVIRCDDGLIAVALPHGVEVINMRSPIFGRAWLVEHAPSAMTPDEALAFSRTRLEQLARTPPVLVHPLDEGYRPAVEHEHAEPGKHSH